MAKKMRLGVRIPEGFHPIRGGGYSYVYTLAKGLIESDLSKEMVLFCDTSFSDEFVKNKKIVCYDLEQIIRSKYFFIRYPYILILLILSPFEKASSYFKKVRNIFVSKIRISLLKKIVKKEAIDIVYYLSQSFCITPDVPFIATHWDTGCRTAGYFPELNDTFNMRTKWDERILPRAQNVFVESEQGKNEVVHYYRIDEARVKIVPMFPGDIIEMVLPEVRQIELLKEYNLEGKKYYLYPAQFWACKNHYNLLRAFNKIKSEILIRDDIQLVFTGGDTGNLNYVKKVVKEFDLEKDVVFLGFVSNELLYTLYKSALALVMPTFLGPTNMPILEAMALKCPVICSDLTGHKGIGKKSFLYFDPSDYLELSRQMKKVLLDPLVRKDLANLGHETFLTGDFNLQSSINSVRNHIEELESIRKCWPS